MIFYRVKSDFCVFIFIRPSAAPVRGRLQLSDFLQVFFIFRLSKSIRLLLVFPPCREITGLDLYGRAVQYKDMIAYTIQQIAVMRHKNEPFL